MKKAILNEYTLNGYTVNSNAPIGAIMLWMTPTAPAGWVFCNHTKLSIADYGELHERLKNIPQCQCEEEGFFYTPDFRDRVPQGANGNLGQLIEAGLPNIEGNAGIADRNNRGKTLADGAFYYDTNTSSSKGFAPSSDTDANIMLFDASKSNPIFGNSDTVQSPANACNFIIKAIHSANLEQNAIDDSKTTSGNTWSAAEISFRTKIPSNASDENLVVDATETGSVELEAGLYMFYVEGAKGGNGSDGAEGDKNRGQGIGGAGGIGACTWEIKELPACKVTYLVGKPGGNGGLGGEDSSSVSGSGGGGGGGGGFASAGTDGSYTGGTGSRAGGKGGDGGNGWISSIGLGNAGKQGEGSQSTSSLELLDSEPCYTGGGGGGGGGGRGTITTGTTGNQSGGGGGAGGIGGSWKCALGELMKASVKSLVSPTRPSTQVASGGDVQVPSNSESYYYTETKVLGGTKGTGDGSAGAGGGGGGGGGGCCSLVFAQASVMPFVDMSENELSCIIYAVGADGGSGGGGGAGATPDGSPASGDGGHCDMNGAFGYGCVKIWKLR